MLPVNPLSRGGIASMIAERAARRPRVAFGSAPPAGPKDVVPFKTQTMVIAPPAPEAFVTPAPAFAPAPAPAFAPAPAPAFAPAPAPAFAPAPAPAFAPAFMPAALPTFAPVQAKHGGTVNVIDQGRLDRQKDEQQKLQQKQAAEQTVGLEMVDRVRSSVLAHGLVAFAIAFIICTVIAYRSSFHGMRDKQGVERFGASVLMACATVGLMAILVWMTNSSVVRAAEVGVPASRRISRAMRYFV